MDSQHAIIGQDISPQLAATAILRQTGMTFDQIGKACNITRQAVIGRSKRLPDNLMLDSRKRLKLAAKASDLILQGLPVGMAEVKGSDVVNLTKAVYDRAQPVRGNEQQAGTSYTQININLYGT